MRPEKRGRDKEASQSKEERFLEAKLATDLSGHVVSFIES